MLTDMLDLSTLPKKISVQRTLGVPYPAAAPATVIGQAEAQAATIADGLRAAGATVAPDREIIALIAYLQKLGKYETVAASVGDTGAKLND